MKYSLENGSVALLKVTNRVNCTNCENLLALTNDDVILLKNPATILDLANSTIVLKCTKCKAFNTYKLSEINQNDAEVLLTL